MKMKNIKRILSTFLIVAMILTMLPTSIFAADNVTIAQWAFSKSTGVTPKVSATSGTNASTADLTTSMGTNMTGSNTNSSVYIPGWGNGAGYWLITLSTLGYENLTISFTTYGTNQGPKDFKLQYSTDDSTYNDVADGVYECSTSALTKSKLALPINISDKNKVYLRFIQTSINTISGTGVIDNSSGNCRMSNIIIDGDVKDGSTTPPSSPTTPAGPTVQAVTADLTSGAAITLGSSVTLSTATSGAAIEYTLNNGTTQTVNATSAAITINEFNQAGNTAVIKAKAIKGADSSIESTFVYTQAQVKAVTASKTGAVLANTKIELTTASHNAIISYIITRNVGQTGQVVDPEATYSAPINLTAEMLPAKIEATAKLAGYKDSTKTVFNYTLNDGTQVEKVYFGQIHSHTTQSDGSGTLAQAYDYAKNTAKLDFFAVTDHSNYFDTAAAPVEYAASSTNIKWQEGISAAAAAASDTFISFYGYEMTWTGQVGHMNTFNTDGFASRNNKTYTSSFIGMKNYYELLKTIPNSVSQFNHPGKTFGDFNGFSNYDAASDTKISLIEVGNGEGDIGSGGYFPSYDYYTKALDKGWHLAPTNNQDNHKGLWGNSNTARTAIVTDTFTKDGVYAALHDMHVYATEDENLQIKYTANDEMLGSILSSGISELKINVDISDPDSSDRIGKVSIITNGGQESNVQNFTSNNATYSATLNNPTNGYYYIKIVQADGNIAVTAPVWVGSVEKIGIAGVSSSVSMPVTGETLQLSTEIFNNEATPITIDSIEYKIGENTIATGTGGQQVAATGTLKDTMYYTPTDVGAVTIDVIVKSTLNSVVKIYTQAITLDVRDATKLINIGIDASHLNDYVAGNYANSMTNFAKLAEEYDVRLVEIKDGITYDKLSGLKGLILTPPNRKTSVGAFAEYSAEEIAAIKNFAADGKTIIVCGLADYGDGNTINKVFVKNEDKYHAAYQQNLILEAINSKARIVDDELIDKTNFVTQNFRLRFKNYNMDSQYNLGVNPDQEYSVYSGASVLVNEVDKLSVTSIVSSHATSESLDSDADGKGGIGNPVATGNIPALTVETLSNGAKVFVAGSIFMSNFEVQATLDNASQLGYSNYNICQNIIKEIAPRTITTIREVQAAAEGTQFTIQGTVTSNASGFDQSTAFFDSIYVQDSTAGINLFPVSGNYKIGQKVEVTGTVGGYQGEKQLTVKKLEMLDSNVNAITPAAISTTAATGDINRGSLVKVEGTIKSVSLANGKVENIVINDGSGDVRVFIDGYINPSVNLDFVKIGEKISAIGLSSVDTLGKRIRVRDRNEISLISKATAGEMKKIGAYSTGFTSLDGGVAEIVKYNTDNNKFYLVNGSEKKVDIVSLQNLASGQENNLTLERRIDVSSMIDGFAFGDITSVDINTEMDIIAIAVQEADYKKSGAVILLDYDGNYEKHFITGVQPDMVCFTPDNNYVLTANEGEPRVGYSASDAVDPMGSVTIVNLRNNTAKTIGFTNFDSSEARSALLADNVILKKQTAPSVDLEPEYIAVAADSKKAFVSLQEANAIATIDIEKGTFTSIKGLGFKDHNLAGNEIDMRRDAQINIKTEANVLGMYNPDGITSYSTGGKTYLITANEGDSRDWNGHKNEKDIVLGKGQDGKATTDMKVTAFDTTNYEVGVNGAGFASDKNYLFGARSFAVWDTESMSLVYDSGADLEKKTAQLVPQYFNWSNDDLVFEKRSTKKGPEPEDVKVGVIDGKAYLFISLERIGGNIMYDISNITAPVFYDYLNTRDFANSVDTSGSKPAYKIAGDVSPEGQCFVAAKDSPTNYPLLLVANEVSGTASVVEIQKGYVAPATEKVINILHTNDSHGRVFPDVNNKGMIGIDVIATINETTLNPILVDAGDTIHGLPIANTTQGSNIIELMNLAGYDVMTPGNHDFNYGSAKLKQYADATTTNFDIISSNVVNKEGQNPFLATTSIQIVDGVKVGFFGLSTTTTPIVTNPVNVTSLEFQEYLASAKKAIEILKSENVNVIVGLTHVSRPDVEALAKELKNDVAVIIDGHDHLSTSETVEGVLISGAGQYEENLGKITLTLNSSNVVTSKVATLITKAQTAAIVPDSEVKTRATEMMGAVNTLFNQKVGTSEVLLDSSRGSVSNGTVAKGVRNSEMPLGNIVTDAMRSILKADIAITNGGGLRANIGIGDVSKGTLNAVLPFGNYGVVKEVTPKQLKAILENGIANAPNPVGQFPHVSGMKFEYNPNAVAGARVTKITIANNVLDLNDTTTIYKLATNDFMSNGGDGYTAIKELKTITEGDSMDVIFENYVKSLPNAKITAENAKIEGRILTVVPTPVIPVSSGTTTVVTPENGVKAGKITISIPTVNTATGEAKTAPIKEESFKKALETATADSQGTKTVKVEIPKAIGATAYTVELPKSALASDNAKQRVEVATEFGTIVAPANMLTASEVANSKSIELKIGEADKKALNENVKAQIGDRPVIELNVKVDGKVIAWNNPSAPVTISIPYTATSAELANSEYLVIWYIDGSGKATKVTGSKYDNTLKTVSFTTTHFSTYAVAYTKKSFGDMQKHSWAVKAVETLASNEIIEGTSNTSFSPGKNITRGEYLGWLVRTLGLTAEFDTNFSDIKVENKYYKEIGIAKALGIASGSDGIYNADKEISRQDMMVLTNKALKVANKNLTAGTDMDISKFVDVKKVAKYAVRDVATMVKVGLIKGSGKNLNPTGTTTRAEAAAVLNNIYTMK